MPAVKVAAEVSPGNWCNYRFDRPFRIGRLKDCDLPIENSFVSGTHAEVVFEAGKWSVRDLGSAGAPTEFSSRGSGSSPFLLTSSPASGSA
jgi:predicted component of type VI protein secretion system